ncbi:MAG: hypothetical protein HUJ26_24490 [Planctomycetaceae bacterium]|nr:hypothetical protein [Planctomycetaceae bacterium]
MTDDVDNDHRLYVLLPDSWTAHAKQNSTKEYCYRKSEGEEHFHLLMKGEIYLMHQGEKYCLNCALQQEAVTRNRMHWQHS